MEKTYLVTCEFQTSITIDDSELSNDELISSMVGDKIIEKIKNNELKENITDIIEDDCIVSPKYKSGDIVSVLTSIAKLLGGENKWVVVGFKKGAYICYKADDDKKITFRFKEDEIELIK